MLSKEALRGKCVFGVFVFFEKKKSGKALYYKYLKLEAITLQKPQKQKLQIGKLKGERVYYLVPQNLCGVTKSQGMWVTKGNMVAFY